MKKKGGRARLIPALPPPLVRIKKEIILNGGGLTVPAGGRR
jgi:hypothetical protein